MIINSWVMGTEDCTSAFLL